MRGFVIGALSLVGLVGCSHPYLRVDASLSAAKPIPGLMVSNYVTTQDDDNQGVVAGAMALVGNASTDQLGTGVADSAEKLLAKRGVTVTYDPARAKTVNSIGFDDELNKLQLLTGMWVDPRGDLFALQSLTPRKLYAKIGDRMNGPEDPEGFVFARTTIVKRSAWLVMRYPQVWVDLEVVSDKGALVYDLHVAGDGRKKFLVCDRSAGNLDNALTDAIARAATLEVEPPKE